MKKLFLLFGVMALLATVSRKTENKTQHTTAPDSSRYARTILAEGLDEPMEMVILPGNDILFVERKGGIRLYKNDSKTLRTIANIRVFSGIEDGLLGIAADPDFEKNHWLYLYYAVEGEKPLNRLSRFTFTGDSLHHASETKILEFGTQRRYCCHSAGYIRFDKNGNLFLSTGDNTNAEETEGYTPVDERPGRELADDQATAANTNDLRGKILRIKPLPEGGYEIPAGNLFAPGTPQTRPEIYAMGMRNPYRFSIDDKTGFLYFGEVGPDTKVKGADGSLMSYDEINQVRKPGFFGWPYFLGNNDIFPHYNYETKQEGPGKNPMQPLNESPNNTGLKELPPAQPAMIWYGKGKSERFPLVGSGGATAMAGPVYNRDHFPDAPYRLSPYYDGKLFIYEWIRGWIMAVSFDEKGQYKSMEPFLKHWQFNAPVDMQIAPDGAIYLLEYGSNWFSKNQNARLVRIEYMEGNRNPIPAIGSDRQYGAAPMAVNFTSEGTIDHDGLTGLTYEWEIEGKRYKGKQTRHVFKKNGIVEVRLTVTDPQGGKGKTTRKIYVGNTPPAVSIDVSGNRTFYWENEKINYRIRIRDLEEQIAPERASISFGYIPNGKDAAIVLTQGQDAAGAHYLKGQTLATILDCRACHSADVESVGPSYLAIAQRYKGKPGIENTLIDKIIDGGSGNWGERAMSPHPDLPRTDAAELVRYILALPDKKKTLPMQGSLALSDHQGKSPEGVYLMRASYTDRGANGIDPLTTAAYITLRNPVLQAEDFDKGNVSIATLTTAFMAHINGITDGRYILFNNIDLKGVKHIGIRVQASGAGGSIEVRQQSQTGPLIGTVQVPAGQFSGAGQGWQELRIPVAPGKGISDLCLTFQNKAEPHKSLFHVDYLKFYNR